MNRVARMTGVLLLGVLTGCAPVWIGVGAAGGYAVSRDSIRNHFDISQAALYDVSHYVLRDLGYVTHEDPTRGRVQGEVDGAKITVTIRPISERTMELTVRGRNRFFMPRIETAHLVYNRIVARLN